MLKFLTKFAPAFIGKLLTKNNSLEEIKKAESRFSKPFRNLKGKPMYFVIGALFVFGLLLLFVDLPETNLDLIHAVLGFIASLV